MLKELIKVLMEIAEAIKIKKQKEKENSNSGTVEDNTYYKGIKNPDYISYIDINGTEHLAESIEEFNSLIETDLNDPNCPPDLEDNLRESDFPALYKQPVETKYIINKVLYGGEVNIVETSQYHENFRDNLYSYLFEEQPELGEPVA